MFIMVLLNHNSIIIFSSNPHKLNYILSLYFMNADIKFLEYKPSTVAAASLIYASYELFPQQYSILRATITTSEHIDKVSLYLYSYIKPLFNIYLLFFGVGIKYWWWLF